MLVLLPLVAVLVFSPGLFFMFCPSCYRAANFVAKQFNTQMLCYDLHGGYECEFDDLPKVSAPMTTGQCKVDSDCLKTIQSSCIARDMAGNFKNILPAVATSEGCKCVVGKVFSGCVLIGSEWERLITERNTVR